MMNKELKPPVKLGSRKPDSSAGTLPALERDEALEALAKQIENVKAKTVLQIGKHLAEARDHLRHRRDDGAGFGGWVQQRLGMSRSSAYRLIEVYETFGGEFVSAWDKLPKAILYDLVGAPQEARDEVAARVQRGDKPKPAEVRQIIADAQPSPARTEKPPAPVVERDDEPPPPAPPASDPRAKWVEETLQQFERDVLSVDPADLLRNAPPLRRARFNRIGALAAEWLNRLSECAGPVGRSLDEARADVPRSIPIRTSSPKADEQFASARPAGVTDEEWAASIADAQRLNGWRP